jgi:hypothetical protein
MKQRNFFETVEYTVEAIVRWGSLLMQTAADLPVALLFHVIDVTV